MYTVCTVQCIPPNKYEVQCTKKLKNIVLHKLDDILPFTGLLSSSGKKLKFLNYFSFI